MKNEKSKPAVRPTRGPAGMPWIGGPIDWAAWEAEAMALGDRRRCKRTMEERQRMSEAQKARFKAQRQRLAEVAAAAPKPPPAPDRKVTVYETILGNMQPGSWYSTRDLADISGENYQSCKALAPKWLGMGWVKRAQNPDWKPVPTGHRQEPKWIYALTAEGEQRHRVAAALL